jgi:hypothetical protein
VSVQHLIRAIEERRTERLLRRSAVYPRNNPVASDLGPCTRETALAILHWRQKPAFEVDLLARFGRGTDIENLILRELSDIGFQVRVDRAPFETRGRDGELLMRGKIDGFVHWQGRDYPMEVKTVSPNIYARLNSVDDFEGFGVMAKYPRQLHAYLYANGLTEGFFLIDDCLGHWKFLAVTLDYNTAEEILQQCEQAVAALERIAKLGAPEDEALPPYHPEVAVCRRRWAFGRVCHPPNLAELDGLRVIEDPSLELMLKRREAIHAVAKEFESLDATVKKTLRHIPQAIVGAYVVQGKEQIRKIKAKEAHDQKAWLTTIQRIVASEEPVPVSVEREVNS